MSEETPIEKILYSANETRAELKKEEDFIRGYVDQIKSAEPTEAGEIDGFNKSECIAQAMLALRHVEDARMRIGKVIQYATGGESVYDKK